MDEEGDIDRERITMVVVIGRIVAETCFRWKMGWVEVTLFIRRGIQMFIDFINRCIR